MRFLPHTEEDRRSMLEVLGKKHVDELFSDIPRRFLLKPGMLNLPEAASEAAILRHFGKAASANRHAGEMRCFLGAGTYHHFVPAAVDHVISRGEFLTAYTPYQPEISQGTLQALFEFQTMIARLLGMDVANASMYDAATSVAEAALMARRITRRDRILMAESVNPRYRAVTENYLSHNGGLPCTIPVDAFDKDDPIPSLARSIDKQTACVIVQNPDFFGRVHELAALRAACDEHGALLVVAFSDATAFGLIEPPGHFGADIACGSGQALGIPMSFGGPHIGLFACRQRFVRQMPGRVCGMTEDAQGRRGFVLTLSTREQHIRREKATSNICSNQGLMCTAIACHLSLLGDTGLREVAMRSAAALDSLIEQLPANIATATGAHYNETVLRFPSPQIRDAFVKAAREADIFAGIPLETLTNRQEQAADLLVATTEMIEAEDIADYAAVLRRTLESTA
ncbi:MAG: aminomethyl-transferring glycine dehydrogenase subunit GcvPA [Gammaproteobacteria bacterium]|nr:MAG: aminomethyl-transferring glycine dehydrogenase subunit GcvPA [Gammaproteobacteria bacterium]